MWYVYNKDNGTGMLRHVLNNFQITFKMFCQFHKCVLIQKVVYVQMFYQMCTSSCYVPRKYAVSTSTTTIFTYILIRKSDVLRITSDFEQQNGQFCKTKTLAFKKEVY